MFVKKYDLYTFICSYDPADIFTYYGVKKMAKYNSTKLFDGYSTCFRQWKADGTHFKFLHGYAVSFRVWFEGELDHRNWVWDFGGMKRAKTSISGMSPKDYFAFLLDHTTINRKRKFIQLWILYSCTISNPDTYTNTYTNNNSKLSIYRTIYFCVSWIYII